MKNLFGYIKLGRLKKKIADEINRKPADIFVEYDHLRHIETRRFEYLQKIEMNAFKYVQKIIANYTEIRKGKNDALLLVAYIDDISNENIAVIELQLIASESMYIVKTAMPRVKFTKGEVALWQK
jgi:hypothetical protein